MSPRGTDWSLAALVGLGWSTGVLTLFAGSHASAWVFTVHAIGGLALAVVVFWKLRRVWGRTGSGVLAAVFVSVVLLSGVAWAYGADADALGYGLLNWHFALGAVLGAIVLVHALGRAKRPRRTDLLERRRLLASAGVGAFAVVAWRAQRPLAGLAGWRGADRRFTGSYEVASLQGNAFPATSWVADDPRPLGLERWRLRVDGLVERELSLSAADLDGPDRETATLDCTGGFYSTQRWGGTSVERLLRRAGTREGASHVRVVSVTGYRWTFGLDEARRLLLATTVGGEPLSHEHGAPVRLVAPGRRGFQWVKWIARLEVTGEPDPAAFASTLWSSFTAKGRGR